MDDHRTVDQRHRITIPSHAFFEAGFRSGERLNVRSYGPGRVIIERDGTDDGLGEAYGDGYIGWITGQAR